jgi:hypothetical protein
VVFDFFLLFCMFCHPSGIQKDATTPDKSRDHDSIVSLCTADTKQFVLSGGLSENGSPFPPFVH